MLETFFSDALKEIVARPDFYLECGVGIFTGVMGMFYLFTKPARDRRVAEFRKRTKATDAELDMLYTLHRDEEDFFLLAGKAKTEPVQQDEEKTVGELQRIGMGKYLDLYDAMKKDADDKPKK